MLYKGSSFSEIALTAAARFPAAPVTLETLDLLLPTLDSKAVEKFDEVPLEGQTFTVEQDEEHRRDDPTQQHQIGDKRPYHTKFLHEPQPQRQICHSLLAFSCICILNLREQCYHQVHGWRKHVGCVVRVLARCRAPLPTHKRDAAPERSGVTTPTVCVGSLTSLHPFTRLKRLNTGKAV